MKSIKYFKFKNTYEFEKCLKEHGYTLNDAVGFSVYDKQQYGGNILKEYIVYFYDHDHIFFKVVYFKSFNECNQSCFGFNGDKMLMWYKFSQIKYYKLSGEYIRD